MELLNEIVNMFSYEFIQRAFIVGLLVSICSSILGVTLVLKRYSMIGDGLGHASFGIISVIGFLNTLPFFENYVSLDPFIVSMFIVIIISVCLLKLSDNGKTNSDSAIAVTSIAFLAIGILVVSFSSGLSTDVHSVMFGSILALNNFDLIITVVLSVMVIVLYVLFYNQIFSITFDETFAKATGIKVNLYKTILAVLTAITIVMGMKLIGTLLISSLLVIPALSSIRINKSFKKVVLFSALFSSLSFILGMIISYIIDLPVGSSIVIMNLFFYIIAILIDKFIIKSVY